MNKVLGAILAIIVAAVFMSAVLFDQCEIATAIWGGCK